MYHISTQLYDGLAARLRESIGGKGYFSGSAEVVSGDTECRLTASIIIYRMELRLPEGRVEEISDAIPVWWECHTRQGAVEIINDCDFSEIRSRLIDC